MMATADMKGGVSCGGVTCMAGPQCCAEVGDGGTATGVCKASCGDGGLPVSCAGPEDCGGGTPYCCAQLNIGGTVPNCTLNMVNVACQKTCNGTLGLTCPMMSIARVCNKAMDCAGDPGGYTNCCQVGTGGITVNLCITNLEKAFFPKCM